MKKIIALVLLALALLTSISSAYDCYDCDKEMSPYERQLWRRIFR